MLKRKIERQLTEWKNTSGHKPLIVKGCRQCGKTFSVLDFAKKNYKHVVYLNFFENPDYASMSNFCIFGWIPHTLCRLLFPDQRF